MRKGGSEKFSDIGTLEQREQRKGEIKMKKSKIISSVLSVSIAVTAFAGFAATAKAAGYSDWVGYSTNDTVAEWNYGADNKDTTTTTGTYDPLTGTLTFTENTHLIGCTYQYGSAIAATTGTDLVIDLAGYDVTVDATQVTSDWIGGIYRDGGSLTIKGPGSLTVTASGGTAENAALMGYNGADISVTEGANVVLSDTESNGYGLWASGNVDVENGTLEMTGGAEAITIQGSGAIETEGKQVTAGENAQSASAWDNTTAITSYKYVKIVSHTPEDPEQPEETELGVTVGGQSLTNINSKYEKDGVTAEYDAETATLTLSGSGTIAGAENDTTNAYGAAIWAQQAIIVELSDGADVTLQGAARGGYSYGISTYTAQNGTLTITGNGKLTVKTDADAQNESAALYTTGDISVKGNADVTAEGTAAKHFAVNRTGAGGSIAVSDNAKFSMINTGKQDLFNGTFSYPSENYVVKALADDGSVAVYDADPEKYKAVNVKPVCASSSTENIGAFKGIKADGTADGTDIATGFTTTITSDSSEALETLYWTVTSGQATKHLFPDSQTTITLSGGSTVITVIVQGLHDETATANAYIY